ncbi:ATP-binding protein [Aliikangiella sp. G2MR2-5]|uniref:ATP-binding protein n=1 Tax=Aliikangiella sp. G2MR2-5 TaxID=2788943 RepID=UPI0018ABEB15|nr:ATP-binding protein [Aliikangiella sp. G2MR2-5]
MPYLNLIVDKNISIDGIISRAEHFAKSITDDEIKTTEITTIISELAYNIIKYSSEGVITLSVDLPNSLLIIAEDNGPGFVNDFEAAMQDGYSSSGSLGLGIPSLIRMCDDLDITTSSSGTKLTCVKEL